MYFDITNTSYILRIRVTPNSSKFAIAGIFTDANSNTYLKVNLVSVPEKGKANQELIKHLSKLLKISKSSFTILSGDTDRYKKISIDITPSETLSSHLTKLGETQWQHKLLTEKKSQKQ